MSTSFKQIKETIAEIDEEILLADGFEGALIGYVEIFNQSIALYDKGKCLEILQKRDGMSREDASEFFEFNTQSAYVGEKTPAFATILRRVR